MESNLYTMTIPVMRKSLDALSAILDNAAAYAATRKTERRDFESALIHSTLIFDQLPFVTQVQIACDNAKGGAARLAGVEPPKFEDNEKTFAELKERVAKTIAFLDTIKPEQIVDQEERKVTLTYFPGKYFTAADYAREYLLPNFYFHYATAYSILRDNGMPIGKANYMGGLTLYDAES